MYFFLVFWHAKHFFPIQLNRKSVESPAVSEASSCLGSNKIKLYLLLKKRERKDRGHLYTMQQNVGLSRALLKLFAE